MSQTTKQEEPPTFEFSPASPSLTQMAKWEEEEESPASPPMSQTTKQEEPPTVYVLPDSSVVVTPDGATVRIPDRSTNQPEPSTSRTHASRNTEVCKITIEESVADIITNEWQSSFQTLEEVTTNMCECIAATILSPEWHQLMKTYARTNILRHQ